MKLYTEEQVRKAVDMARKPELFGTRDIRFMYSDDHIVLSLTPIELPTDEEIVEASKNKSAWEYNNESNFRLGAAWMRDKIKGGEQ